MPDEAGQLPGLSRRAGAGGRPKEVVTVVTVSVGGLCVGTQSVAVTAIGASLVAVLALSAMVSTRHRAR